MKALLKLDKGLKNVSLREVPEPDVKGDEIKIKVHAAGICGTDLHIIKDEYPANYPVIMGHEFSGIVEEVGSNVKKFNENDRVVSLTAVVTCGNCKYCNTGLLMLCEQRKSIGSGVNGAFAEYISVPANLAFKLPATISLDEAALTEPLACIVRCVIERGTVKPGDNVIVSGPGPIGLLTAQVAKASGGHVTVLGITNDSKRLELAKELGVDEVVMIDTDKGVTKINEIMESKGFDVAFECSGVEASANNCLKFLNKTGLYVQVGLFGKRISFDMDLALMKEIMITNGFASEPTSWEIALRLLERGQVNVRPLISDKLSINEWKKGFEISDKKKGYKVLLDPNM
ncbi:zinc-binding dehydrogenase [Radiobacillus sp. PE A8.2]|uniref:zinc-dependent alcohol dehydrogenase n=1 Tax=Radiobacillus sp. PE A8.2 TaxID=3380349 RepID=UPI00388DF6E2